jgi:hypothetical protein
VNGEVCEHKDCEHTDATPVEFMLYRHGELLDERTYYFCLEHRKVARLEDDPDAAARRNGSRAPIPTSTYAARPSAAPYSRRRVLG